MPFAGYKDFAACVRANADKDNPEGYCGEIQRRVEKRVGITKVDEAKQQVFGWSSLSEVAGHPAVDLQDDIIEPAELEKAVYSFVMDGGFSGAMHEGVAKGRVIESVVFTPEKLRAMGFEGESFTRHWLGVQFSDPATFAKCKSGEFTGFSIQGSGVRVEV